MVIKLHIDVISCHKAQENMFSAELVSS